MKLTAKTNTFTNALRYNSRRDASRSRHIPRKRNIFWFNSSTFILVVLIQFSFGFFALIQVLSWVRSIAVLPEFCMASLFIPVLTCTSPIYHLTCNAIDSYEKCSFFILFHLFSVHIQSVGKHIIVSMWKYFSHIATGHQLRFSRRVLYYVI